MTESMKYEEYLDRYGSLTYANVGVSMLPMLREGKDLFTVVKKGPERCKAGDVVLYRRGSHYILHRKPPFGIILIPNGSNLMVFIETKG